MFPVVEPEDVELVLELELVVLPPVVVLLVLVLVLLLLLVLLVPDVPVDELLYEVEFVDVLVECVPDVPAPDDVAPLVLDTDELSLPEQPTIHREATRSDEKRARDARTHEPSRREAPKD
jgi:hypothetical protein